MRYEDFKEIYDSLGSSEDIYVLADRYQMDDELCRVIYTQKTVRETKKRHHKVKRNAWRLVKDWKHGTTLMELSREWDFAPVLTAMLVFMEMGWSKKQFWAVVHDPEGYHNNRIRAEVMEIVENDIIYSPWGNKVQHERGEWGERLLQEWLDSHGIQYRTEEDLRGEFPKTPDCLFDEPVELNGSKVNWIESKATFGDDVEVRWNTKKQLIPYTELFGDGIVVYWFGYLDDVKVPEGVGIADISITDLVCKQ